MTHVFVVNKTTFKYHLEYLFAGTGAQNKQSKFLTDATVNYPATTERMLVEMIADISRIRKGDNVIFYLQSSSGMPGMFFGIFKVASEPFFDENDAGNYLVDKTQKGLSFKVLLAANNVYAKGITEHEYLDSLDGKESPCDLCWSLIYRKLKGNRGCTMIMDYEFDDLAKKLQLKNDGKLLSGNSFTFDDASYEITTTENFYTYEGRKARLDILPRLIYKNSKRNAFETHLQAYITQNIENILSGQLIPLKDELLWIGNEVSCGVGMQRIDVMLKQENDKEVFIRLIELKDEAPYLDIIRSQIPWYLEWLSYYVLPKYKNKMITVIPTIIAKGAISEELKSEYQMFDYNIPGVAVNPLEYYGFNIDDSDIVFQKYI